VLGTTPAAGIDDLFASMVEEHGDRLYSTALRLTGRRADAEDLAAEALLRAYRSLCGFEVERLASLKAGAWLSTILINQWRNQLRTASRRPVEASPHDSDRSDLPDDRPGVEFQVEDRQVSRDLAAMLATLPERQREALVLRYIGDLSVDGVAEAMGCPTGTARSHISRGLAALRAVPVAEPRPCGPDRGARP
jgi:RNA polymerase sigma-70 factor (ECF subfamily)